MKHFLESAVFLFLWFLYFPLLNLCCSIAFFFNDSNSLVCKRINFIFQKRYSEQEKSQYFSVPKAPAHSEDRLCNKSSLCCSDPCRLQELCSREIVHQQNHRWWFSHATLDTRNRDNQFVFSTSKKYTGRKDRCSQKSLPVLMTCPDEKCWPTAFYNRRFRPVHIKG